MTTGRNRLLYRGRSAPAGFEIFVTTDWCLVNGIRYPMSGLSLVGSSRGRRDLRRGRKMGGLVAVTALLVGVAVAIGGGWTGRLWIALTVALVATTALSFLPGVLGVVLRRPYQIWARYGGADVLLFVTEDAEQHGQVARAFVRARELARDGAGD